MVNNDIYMDLITGDDVVFQGIKIHPPTFREIKKIGINLYNQIMTPYSITLDCFDGLKDKEDLDLFKDILLKDKSIVSNLIYSLLILTNSKEIILYEDYIALDFGIQENGENKVFSINSDNYEDLSEIILKINANKKIEIEKPPNNMSKKQKDIWDKLQAGRKKEAAKNEIHLFDILNICEFGGKYHIPISEMMDWTLWKIINCYKAILNIKTYDDNLKICLVSGDGKTISGDNHWHKKLMIRD